MTDRRCVSVSPTRRFARRLAGFDAPLTDVAAAISHHGFIQIDPINVCGRMQDLILRNRVAGYRQDGLMPISTAMRERTRRDGAWFGRLTVDKQAMAPDLLAEIADRGPLSSSTSRTRSSL